MRDNGVDVSIIPSTDPHFGEYTQDHYKIREWLSGFTGSAATLVITEESAALWTDSRYFIQAQEQLKGSDIHLMKIGTPQTPTIEEWIVLQLCEGVIALDYSLFSNIYIESLKSILKSFVFKDWKDQVSIIWHDRPTVSFKSILYLKDEYSGMNPIEKLSLVNKRLRDSNPKIKSDKYIYLISSCDDICWLCNIRGTDIPYNPLVQCFAAFTANEIYLFISPDSLDYSTKSLLNQFNIHIRDYKSFTSFITKLDNSVIRVGSVLKLPASIFNLASISGEFIEDKVPGGIISITKACKNSVEQRGFFRASLEDGIAWAKVLHILSNWRYNGNNVLYERDIANLFVKYRGESRDYRGESFAPIVAYAVNGALPHYSIVDNGSQIFKSGFLLIDTGAHYFYGTTDTTRTICLGDVSDSAKLDYTMVLKGMISLSMASFPYGTRGASLDILARSPLYSIGKRYLHGTGHGVGHYLCVHEGPQSIRVEENPVVLEPGMVISNEPAVYEEDQYGVRIENLILCKDDRVTSHARFCSFDTLTLVPIERECVIDHLLTLQERTWLNAYNMRVYETLSPYLEESVSIWLKEACLPI